MDARQGARHVRADGPVDRHRRRDPRSAGARHPVRRQRRDPPGRHDRATWCSRSRGSSRSSPRRSRWSPATSSTPAPRPASASAAPPIYLQPGDTVRVEIDRIGAIENRDREPAMTDKPPDAARLGVGSPFLRARHALGRTYRLGPADRARPRRVVRAHRDEGPRCRGRARGRRRARSRGRSPRTRWPSGSAPTRTRSGGCCGCSFRSGTSGSTAARGGTTRRPSCCARIIRTRCGTGCSSSAATGWARSGTSCPTSVRTGGSGTEAAFGLEYFELMQQRPETGARCSTRRWRPRRGSPRPSCARVRLRRLHPGV